MTTISLHRFGPVMHRHHVSLTSVVRERLVRAWRNFTTRRDLAAMDDRMLQDLGISRAQAHFEVNRSIWR
jgi:uncharacterized protein YjiS (DUF1127 family)